MFDIGEEVVCVDDSKQHVNGITKVIHKGNKYRIRWIGKVITPHDEVVLCVRLRGIERHTDDFAAVMRGLPGLIDMPFRATRFAPIKKKETDISVFKEILNKVPEIENV